MQCKFYGIIQCSKATDPSFPCCSKEHGYLHKGMIEQLKKYQKGNITWRYLWTPTEEIVPSIEKLEYYASLIKNEI